MSGEANVCQFGIQIVAEATVTHADGTTDEEVSE